MSNGGDSNSLEPMASLDRVQPLLKRFNVAFYIVPVTYAYLYYLYGTATVPYIGEVSLVWPLLVTLIASSYMYIEAESRQNVPAAREEISLWWEFELSFILLLVLAAALNVVAFVLWIDWQGDLKLAGLGFLNLVWVIGALVDRVYRFKFNRHYRDKAVAAGQLPSQRGNENASDNGGNGETQSADADETQEEQEAIE